MNTRKAYFHQKLKENNIFHQDVITNIDTATLPESSRQGRYDTDKYIQVFRKLLSYDALSTLNTYLQRYHILPVCELSDPVDVIKFWEHLEQKALLNKEMMIIHCLLTGWGWKINFYKSINHICNTEADAEKRKLFFSTLLSHYEHSQGKLNLSKVFDFVVIAIESNIFSIEPDFISKFANQGEYTNQGKQSCSYLHKRNALTLETYHLITTFYVSPRWQVLEGKKKKPKNHYEFALTQQGTFFRERTEKPPTFEPAAIIFALFDTGLMHLAPRTLNKASIYFTDFISELYHLGKLTAERLTEALELKKRTSKYLNPLIDSAYDNLTNTTYKTKKTRVSDEEEKLATENDWSDSELASLGTLDAPEKFIKTALPLQNAGFKIRPGEEHDWLLDRIKNDQISAKQSQLLIQLQQYSTQLKYYWPIIETFSDTALLTLPAIFYRLDSHQLCHAPYLGYVLQAQNPLLSVELIIQLALNSINIDIYWEELIQCKLPTLFMKGLLVLKVQELLSVDHAKLLASSLRPDLAANALVKIILRGISPTSIWSNLASSETPEQELEFQLSHHVSSDTRHTLEEVKSLPEKIQAAITQSTSPEETLYMTKELMCIDNITVEQIAMILANKSNVTPVITALKALSKQTTLNEDIINIIIEDPELLGPLQSFLRLNISDHQLLNELCSYKSEKIIDYRLTLYKLQTKFEDYAEKLFDIFNDKKSSKEKLDKFIQAIVQLGEQEQIDQLTLSVLAVDIDSLKLIKLIAILRRDSLYTKENLKLIVNRDLQDKAEHYPRISAIISIAENATLNATALKYISMGNDYYKLVCLGRLAVHPAISRFHVDWLHTIFEMKEISLRDRDIITDLFDKLIESNLLTEPVMQQLIARGQRDAPSFIEIAFMIQYIPTKFLDQALLEKVFLADNVCKDENDTIVNPLQMVVHHDDTLLTREVVHIILKGSFKDTSDIPQILSKLKNADLYQSEIILECKTIAMANAYIQLHTEGELTAEHRELLQQVSDPREVSKLIILLKESMLYDTFTLALLKQQAAYDKNSGSNFHHARFASVISSLFKKNNAISRDCLHMLLSKNIDWSCFKKIIDYINLDNDSLFLIMGASEKYLSLVIHFHSCIFDSRLINHSELVKYIRYESILNQDSIMNHLKQAVQYNADTQYNLEKLKKTAADLWQYCEAENTEEILNLFNSALINPDESIKADSTLKMSY